jgi:thiamine-phosphate pyrophosphorylase
LYVLLDGRASEGEFARLVEALVQGGVHALQLRDKTLTDGDLLSRARILRKRTEGTETLFIMNDRPDLAALSHADGVHVGQDELSVKDARAIVGPRALIGVSTHSIEQARQAVLDGANYIGVGPVFESQTKQFYKFPGLELVRSVAAEIKLPAFAIGGVTLGNIGEVLATGATRVAVSGAIVNAENPDAAARIFLARLTPQ